jgi:hypothetical protein
MLIRHYFRHYATPRHIFIIDAIDDFFDIG